MIRRKPNELRDAVVVITGASSGIGRAAAHAFAVRRSNLVLGARSAESLVDVLGECQRMGVQAVAVPTDVGDAAAVEELRRRAVDRFGRIDVWVEGAGMLVAGPIVDDDAAEIERLVRTNVLGTYLGSRAALRTFTAQGHGVLINIGSLLGLVPNPVVPAYVMTKFAVRGLSLSLRRAVAGERGIDVCVVLPGPVDTPLFEHAANHTGRQLRSIPPAIAPERVAAAIVSCAARPRRQVTAGVVPHGLLVAHRLAPRLTEWGVAQWAGRTVTRTDSESPNSGTLFTPADLDRMHGGYRLGALRRSIGERLGRRAVRAGAR